MGTLSSRTRVLREYGRMTLHEVEPAIDQRADDMNRATVEAVRELPVRLGAVV